MGKHLIVDASAHRNLASSVAVEAFLMKSAALAGMQVIGHPHLHVLPSGTPTGPGITGVVVIITSHLSVHTFPEHNRISFDAYSCKDFDADELFAFFQETFGVTNVLVYHLLDRI